MPAYTENQETVRKLLLQLKALEASYLTQKVCFFRPNPLGEQKKFFEEQGAQTRLVLGDNRSGKSVCGVNEAIAHSLGHRPWLDKDDPNFIVRLSNGDPIPVPNIGRVIAQNFQQAIRQNIWPKFLEWAPRGWYTYKKDNRGIPVEMNWKNGSVVHFMSDKQDDMDFEGTSGHWFWGDEPFGYKKYVALQRGLVDYSGHCWLTLTPLSQFWIQDVIEDRAGDADGKVKRYRFTIEDNERTRGGYLSRDAIEDFRSTLREDELGARFGGQWMHMTGRVYKEWTATPPYWIEPFKDGIPDSWPRVCVIDPHPKKPIAVMWAAVNPDNQWYVYRELFDESLVTVGDVAAKIKELEKDETVATRLIDPASREHERTSGYTVQSMFAQHGIYCLPAPKRNAQAGYDAIHDALKIKFEWSEPSLIVINTCPTVKRNFLRFVWKEWESSRDRDLKGERQEVLKHEDDFIDNIRYIFQAGLTYGMLKRELRRHPQHSEVDDMDGFSMITGRDEGARQDVGYFSEVWPSQTY